MNRRWTTRWLTRCALATCLALSLTACDDDNNHVDRDDDTPSGDSAFRLQLLHFADMDGSTAALGNVSRFSALMNAFKSVPELADNTLVLSSGDNYIPGPRFFAAGVETDQTVAALGVPGNGRGDIVFLNAFDTAASTVGNHDLDQGTAAFADLIAADADYPGAAFPYMSTNLDFSTDDNLAPLAADDGQPVADVAGRVTGFATVDVDGETIGLVAASTPALASITSTGGITITPDEFSMDAAGYDALAAVIQPSIDTLTERGIDKIIVMTHMQQIAIEQALATRLSNVDVIIAGGSNTLLADNNDILRAGDTAADTYPLSYEGPDGSPTLLVNVDGDYKYLGRLVMRFDAAGEIETDALDSVENGAWATTDDIVARLANRGLDAEASDQVLSVQSALQDVLRTQDGNIQGITEVYLDGRRGQVRTEETNLGNLTADANLYYSRLAEDGVQISLKNGGGIRDAIGRIVVPPGSTGEASFAPPQANPAIDKPAGGVSQFDIAGALRFNNNLTLITLTAAELRDVLEYAVAATEPGATPGRFPQIGGLMIAFDPERTARTGGQMNLGAGSTGNRIREVSLIDDDGNVTQPLVNNGQLVVDPATPIRTVLLGFTAACVSGPQYDAGNADCGDGYPLKGLSNPERREIAPSLAGDDSDSVDTGYDPGRADFSPTGGEQDALAEYLQARYNPNNDNGGNAFDRAETPVAEDERIVNRAARRNDG